MADAFVGEIRAVGFNFAPTGWAFCDGQLLPIAQNTALFSLLGTMYGGNGVTTFALPNLQDRSPIHQGQGPGLTPRQVGEAGGQAAVALIESELPTHGHQVQADTGAGSVDVPTGKVWAATSCPTYSPDSPDTTMSPSAISVAGDGLPHNNRQPYLGLNFIIALQGIFPPRS